MNTSTSSVTVKLLINYNLIFMFCWLSGAEAKAQNIGINGTGANAHPSALLDLDSAPTNNTGFAMPRLTTTQRLLIASPLDGLQVYDTSLKGFYYFNTTTNKWDCVTTPAGTFNYFCNTNAPIGYLICDGSAVSRTTYPELFNAITTLYGSGDGATTFNLPDLRSEFIRGIDRGRGIDFGRIFGSYQTDDFQSHNHQTASKVINGGSGSNVDVSSSASSGGWGLTTNTGGNETRPRNVALLPCIKY